MKKFSYRPAPTISKKVASELNLDHPLAKRLIDLYNDRLYQDVPNDRVKSGSRTSQILLALSYPKLAHLQPIALDSSHPHHYVATCILSAAGWVRATGADAITQSLLQ